jgi:hypothetical protein
VVDPEDPIQNDALAVTWTTLYTGAPVHSHCVEFMSLQAKPLSVAIELSGLKTFVRT